MEDHLHKLIRVRSLAVSGAARMIRQSVHLTQGDVAEAIRVSPSTVCRWETGSRAPRGAPALRYLDLLDELVEGSP